MTLGSKEHYDILDNFEKNHKYLRLDREEQSLWGIGQVYQNGETNNLYKSFILGYSLGRCQYLNQ